MLGVGWKEKKKKLFPFWRKEGDYNKVIADGFDSGNKVKITAFIS